MFKNEEIKNRADSSRVDVESETREIEYKREGSLQPPEAPQTPKIWGHGGKYQRSLLITQSTFSI